MNKISLAIFASFISFHCLADSVPAFTADCEEGKTYRYDGGNGLDLLGNKADMKYGWMTEKWGGVKVSWSGGEIVKIGQLDFLVANANNGVLSAVWAGDNGAAKNIYSFVIDLEIGEAVYSQVHASSINKDRNMKARSQNLNCDIKLTKK